MNDQHEDDQIAQARHRDETEAYLLGNHTPVEKMLDQAQQHETDFRTMLRIIEDIARDPSEAEFWQGQCQLLAERYRSL